MPPRLHVRSDLQPSLWESANSLFAGESPSVLAEVPGRWENASDASPQPQQVAARAGDDTEGIAQREPPESRRRRFPVQRRRHTGAVGRSAALTTSTPVHGKPLVWGQWPRAEEPLVIAGDTDDTVTDSERRRWVFVREMACGKELLGVLLAPWEQRAERERVAQRWVAIERVRRVIESTAKGM